MDEENDLGWKDRMKIEETEQRAVTREIQQDIRNLARQNRILKSMAIDQFLNPEGEEMDDDLEVIVDEIAKVYSTRDRTHETDEENIVIPRVG